MDGTAAAEVTLHAHVVQLRGRCKADSRLQGGDPNYREQIAIFEDYVHSSGYILATDERLFLDQPPDDEGNEHQVWYEPGRDSFLKATWPGFFGKLVVHAPDESPDASPIDYLERWWLHCQLFGDSVEFLGVIENPEGWRLVIRQRAVSGEPTDDTHIRKFFEQGGWEPFQIDGDLAFYDRKNRVVISDTHPGNMVLMADGLLAPIDLRVQRLGVALEEAVERLVE